MKVHTCVGAANAVAKRVYATHPWDAGLELRQHPLHRLQRDAVQELHHQLGLLRVGEVLQQQRQ